MDEIYVVDGASLRCSFGNREGTLKVSSDRETYLHGQLQANSQDFIPSVNIMPLGMCGSLSNPAVAAATAANYGRLTRMPCTPVITMQWINGKADTLIEGSPALLNTSTTMCMWCGKIIISDDGQNV